MHRNAPILLGLLTCLLTVPALACSGGQEWTSDVGMYTTDVTNDTPFIDPGQPVHFDFVLINKSDPAYGPQEIVPYSIAIVTIVRGDETIFAHDLPYETDREQAGFDFPFPEKNATYTLGIRYMKNGKELAATMVPLTVGTGDPLAAGIGIYAIGGISMGALALGGSRMLRRRKAGSMKLA